jgi:hypothetical protein
MNSMNPTAPARPKIRADVEVGLGTATFMASFRDELSPKVCAEMRGRLPILGRVLHARWSGEAIWLPLGFDLPATHSEHATSYPAPGDVLIAGPGVSEGEILIAYGPCRFASRAGQLAGTPFLSIREDLDGLAQVGSEVLQHGGLPLVIRQMR